MCDSVCVDVKILQSEQIQKHFEIIRQNSILYKSVKYFKEFMQSFRIYVYMHSETIFVNLRYDNFYFINVQFVSVLYAIPLLK